MICPRNQIESIAEEWPAPTKYLAPITRISLYGSGMATPIGEVR
jgi:hypothetical protein